jgi:hypothetical protein
LLLLLRLLLRLLWLLQKQYVFSHFSLVIIG